MNAGATNLANSYKSWGLKYRAIAFKNFKKGADHRKGVFSIEQTDNWEDRVGEIYTTGDYAVWHDNTTPNDGEVKEGYRKSFTQVRYSQRFGFGHLASKYTQKEVRQNEKAMLHLGAKAYRIEQKAPWSMLTYGAFADTNSYLTGLVGSSVSSLLPDGKRICSVSHPKGPDNSGTWSNASATNATVSEASLKAGLQNLEGSQYDYDGELLELGTKGVIWYVSIQDYDEALRIVGSPLRSGVSDNDKNVFKSGEYVADIEVRTIPTWLRDATNYPRSWFLMDKETLEMYEPLRVFTSEPFNTKSYALDSTETAYVRGAMAFTVGAVSPHGIYGSLGTGTGTYTS